MPLRSLPRKTSGSVSFHGTVQLTASTCHDGGVKSSRAVTVGEFELTISSCAFSVPLMHFFSYRGNWNRDLAVSDHSMTIVPDASGHQELPWDCDDFCSTIPGWLCRRLTFGYCSSSSGRNLFNTESSETEVSDDGEHREMPWHCPTYCKYMSRWWCEKLTRGYCW